MIAVCDMFICIMLWFIIKEKDTPNLDTNEDDNQEDISSNFNNLLNTEITSSSHES